MTVASASQYRGKAAHVLPQQLCYMSLLPLRFPEASAHEESGDNQQGSCPCRHSHFLHTVWGGIKVKLFKAPESLLWFMVDSSGASLVTRCRGFGGPELKARDVCSVGVQWRRREAFVS